MKIYWAIKSIPEMEGLSKPLQKAAWSYSWKKSFRHWQPYLALLFIGISSYLAREYFGPAGAVLFGALGALAYGHAVTKVSRPYIKEYRNIHNI